MAAVGTLPIDTPSLRSLVIPDYAFANASFNVFCEAHERVLRLDPLLSLEAFEVGRNCFNNTTQFIAMSEFRFAL